jgi:anaerobic C4-dicarboxylate transporter
MSVAEQVKEGKRTGGLEMTVILSIGIGLLMMGVAVAIAGLALEIILLIMSRSLTANPSQGAGQADKATVIHLKGADPVVSNLVWAKEAAA